MNSRCKAWAVMSAFAVAGIVLVKLGPKISGLIALGCTLLGSIVGALANGPAVLLGGRVIEGIGLGLITVIAPAVISMWFPPEKRGIPMGIWASWVLVGSFIPTATFTLAPETMPDPRFAGLALGIVSVGQNLGMFFGPPIVGANIAGGNWAAGITPLLISLVVGIIASIVLRARQSQTPEPVTQPSSAP